MFLLCLYGIFPLSPCILGVSLYFLISSYKDTGHIELGPILLLLLLSRFSHVQLCVTP